MNIPIENVDQILSNLFDLLHRDKERVCRSIVCNELKNKYLIETFEFCPCCGQYTVYKVDVPVNAICICDLPPLENF